MARACAELAQGRYADAAAAFERIVQADQGNMSARTQWAYALAALGKFDDVDRILRAAPAVPTPEDAEPNRATTPQLDPQTAIMLWRQAFNIYRYYYYVADADPSGVFRVAAIRDALEAEDLANLPIRQLPEAKAMPLQQVFELLALWLRWDRVARDADLFPNRRWIPLLVVKESERLRDRADRLVELESQAAGAVWLHPDVEGNWLVHPGAIATEGVLVGPERSGAVPDELTETAGPSADLVPAWGLLADWLAENVPSAAIMVIAAVRPSPDCPFDRRLAIIGRLREGRLHVERIGITGPPAALLDGYTEYRALTGTGYVSVQSDVEIDSLSAAFSADGSDAEAFRVYDNEYVVADDRIQLACLLSYVRHGAALFGEPVVMTTAPSE